MIWGSILVVISWKQRYHQKAQRFVNSVAMNAVTMFLRKLPKLMAFSHTNWKAFVFTSCINHKLLQSHLLEYHVQTGWLNVWHLAHVDIWRYMAPKHYETMYTCARHWYSTNIYWGDRNSELILFTLHNDLYFALCWIPWPGTVGVGGSTKNSKYNYSYHKGGKC